MACSPSGRRRRYDQHSRSPCTPFSPGAFLFHRRRSPVHKLSKCYLVCSRRLCIASAFVPSQTLPWPPYVTICLYCLPHAHALFRVARFNPCSKFACPTEGRQKEQWMLCRPLWCREQPAPWRRFGSSRLGYCVGTGESKDIFLELMLSPMLSQWDPKAIPVSTSLSTAPLTYGACCVQRCVPSAAPACQYAKVVRLRVASIPSYHLLLSRRAVLASQLWQLRIPHSHVGGLSCKG